MVAVDTGQDMDFISLAALKTGRDIDVRSESGNDVISTYGLEANRDVIVGRHQVMALLDVPHKAGRHVKVSMDSEMTD